jgi:hypothetical protein
VFPLYLFCLPIFYISTVYVNILGHLNIIAMCPVVATTVQSSLAGIRIYVIRLSDYVNCQKYTKQRV